MYEEGTKGAEENKKKALKYYRKAADRGEIDALSHLSQLYWEGIPGVLEWFVHYLAFLSFT